MKRNSTLSRHQRDCRICRHREREAIEEEIIDWESPSAIARRYRIGSRNSVYRHAKALGLFAKRDRNIRAALGKIIERASNVGVTGATMVQACALLAKLNSRGQWIDRSQTVSVSELFGRMTAVELDEYAKTGQLPVWFEETLSGTSNRPPQLAEAEE
jgi:hypothetical protein